MKIRGRLLVVLVFLTLFSHVQNLPTQKSLANCNQFLHQLDCYYFACIDSIYQCGVKNILVQFSYHFCEALLERTYFSLTPSGQIWSNATHQCLMKEIDSFFQSNRSITCSKIDQYVLSKYPICLTQSHPNHSLCSIICNNLEIFFEIFHRWNMDAFSLKRLFIQTSELCPEKSQMKNVIDLQDSDIEIIFWSLCLDSLKINFQDFQPNEVMIRIKKNSGIFAEFIEEEPS